MLLPRKVNSSTISIGPPSSCTDKMSVGVPWLPMTIPFVLAILTVNPHFKAASTKPPIALSKVTHLGTAGHIANSQDITLVRFVMPRFARSRQVATSVIWTTPHDSQKRLSALATLYTVCYRGSPRGGSRRRTPHTHVRTHARTHTHTHARTHACTHTHTHTNG